VAATYLIETSVKRESYRVEEITINAPAAHVFDAFTNLSERIVWWTAPVGRFRTTRAERKPLRTGRPSLLA